MVYEQNFPDMGAYEYQETEDLMFNEGLWTVLITYDSNNRIQYVGKAIAGTEENESKWAIFKRIYDGTSTRILSETWAGGDTSMRWRWDLRATYTYS